MNTRIVPVDPTEEIIETMCGAGVGAKWPDGYGQEAQRIRRTNARIAYNKIMILVGPAPEPQHAEPALPKCSCEEPWTLGVVHRADKPCYWPPRDQEAAISARDDVIEEPMATVLAEVEKAVAKFPTWPTDPIHAYAVLNEECGELDKAVLQMVYEPHKTSMAEVRTEAIQTAAMAIRFLQSLDVYEFKPCEQHKQKPIRALKEQPK